MIHVIKNIVPKLPIHKKNELVDLTQKPESAPSANEKMGITIGDLHANIIKLLFFLIKEGIVDTTDENYNQLVNLYQQIDFTNPQTLDQYKQQLDLFKNIIQRLTIKNKTALVRLIGDELADRGKNDLFILLLMDKLFQEDIQLEVLVSNHGIEFIKAFEKKSKFKSDMIGHMAQSISMENMQKYIDMGLIAREEVEAIVQRAYLPNLKLISYSMDKDKSNIRIYSHAPIDLAIVKQVAKKLNVPYKDDTVDDLAYTIDAINQKFQNNYVATGKINTLFNNLQDNTNPFTLLVWNRNYRILDRKPKHNNYNVYYIHGHDPTVQVQENVINLDNFLGKPAMLQGLYNVMHTFGTSLADREVRESTFQAQEYTEENFYAHTVEIEIQRLEQCLVGKKLKVEAIRTALNALNKDEAAIKEALANEQSTLYKALNHKRHFPFVSYVGYQQGFFSSKSKSLIHIEEAINSSGQTDYESNHYAC